jgi:ubiquinol-cytochrome c reductase cytochrome b subunit
MSTDSSDRNGRDARDGDGHPRARARRRSARPADRRRQGTERAGRRPQDLPGPLRWLDEQLGIVTLARAASRRLFPDHWSFLLGQIALFSFVVILLSGIYLTFFFTPDARQTVYDGPYAPLRGARVSATFDSVMRLSFEVRAGLLMRQAHHWAALVFVAAIVVHLCRVFFTGAFRRPRQVNYLIGFVLLLLALADGLTGYTLPDDLLSGISLRIIYSAVLGIPVIGTWVAFLFFGGEYPTADLISRLYIFHVALLPALLIGALLLHLALVVWQKHTQFPGPGRTNSNVVGKRLWPVQTVKYLALLLLTASVLALLGGLAQINPVWQYGPFDPAAVTSPAQPDWYNGWLDGILRLAPPWDFHIFGYTVSELFLPGIVLPAVLLGLVAVWPFIEVHFTKDRREHHLLDRPRDVPFRTATGVAGLSIFFVLFLADGNDIIGAILKVPVETISRILQVLFIAAPVVCWLATYYTCKTLRDTGAHPDGPALARSCAAPRPAPTRRSQSTGPPAIPPAASTTGATPTTGARPERGRMTRSRSLGSRCWA